MRKYQCHKTVEAAEIVGVYTPHGAATEGYVNFLDTDGKRCVQLAETGKGNLFARGRPHVGDYLVKYDDGYMAWSPKQAFEDGYTLIRECKPVDPRRMDAVGEKIKAAATPAAGSPGPQTIAFARIVNYHDGRAGYCCKPAIVTGVATDRTVNLCVFPTGFGDSQVVPILVERVRYRGPMNTGAGWSWPEVA